jgi:hypothetical protein
MKKSFLFLVILIALAGQVSAQELSEESLPGVTPVTEPPEEITLENISGYDKDCQDTQTITVTVREQQAHFKITVEGQRQIIINLDDPVTGIPDSISISRTEEPEWILSGDYAEYAWFINGNLVSNEKAFILKASELSLRKNNLRVEVKTDTGIFYSKELVFSVTR